MQSEKGRMFVRDDWLVEIAERCGSFPVWLH